MTFIIKFFSSGSTLNFPPWSSKEQVSEELGDQATDIMEFSSESIPLFAAETFSDPPSEFTLMTAKQYVTEIRNVRETNNIRNVTGIAIPLLDSRSLEDALFKFSQPTQISPYENQGKRKGNLQLFSFRESHFAFSDNNFFSVKIRWFVREHMLHTEN